MIDVEEKKRKIISFLDSDGPSLPVRIAKKIEMEPVFASAILSELLNERRIKLSHMKIGASPLYLLPNQEKRLEDHDSNLKSVEREAYLKLKEKKFLIDKNEIPAIRVALRNLKDFAKSFNFDEKIIWRYSFISEEEIINLLKKKEEKPLEKIGIKKNLIKEKEIPKEDIQKEKEIEDIFKETKEESRTEFSEEVKNFLLKNKIKLVEGIQEDKKEIVAKISIETTIGELNFLLIAKNKKTTSKDEINSALQRARYNKMPCLYLLKKEPQKSILKFIEEHQNSIKIKIL
jgi:NADH dehydrogenase/NADH:ubiquinone oxidoreductase subunit G